MILEGRSNGTDDNGGGRRVRVRHRSAEEWGQIVRESLTSGLRVAEVAQRHGVSRSQLSKWRVRARRGELALPGEQPQAEPAFVPVSVEELGERGWTSIEGRGVTVRLEAAVDPAGIASIAVALAGRR